MADDHGTRLRNVSSYGDIDVPDLGRVIAFHHEVVVEDDALAARLVESGHFTAVGKPGPKPTVDDGSGGGEGIAPTVDDGSEQPNAAPPPDGPVQPTPSTDDQPTTPGVPS